jgi:hypothetical protein
MAASKKAIAAQGHIDEGLKFLDAVARADKDGKYSDVAEVENLISVLPDSGKIALLSATVESGLINANFKGKGSQVLVRHEIGSMRGGLNYEESSGIERLMIDRIINCWLSLSLRERELSLYDDGCEHLIKHVELAESRMQKAHARYLKAVEQLAKIRFLMSRTNPARLAAVREVLQPGKGWPYKIHEVGKKRA